MDLEGSWFLGSTVVFSGLDEGDDFQAQRRVSGGERITRLGVFCAVRGPWPGGQRAWQRILRSGGSVIGGDYSPSFDR